MFFKRSARGVFVDIAQLAIMAPVMINDILFISLPFVLLRFHFEMSTTTAVLKLATKLQIVILGHFGSGLCAN